MVSLLFVSLSVYSDDINSVDGALLTPKDKLLARVEDRWSFLKVKSYDDSYKFFSPARRRLVSLAAYTSLMGESVDWVDVSILSADIESMRAVVLVDVSYKLSLPGPEGMLLNDALGVISKSLKEVWVWREGQWWYVNPMDSKL